MTKPWCWLCSYPAEICPWNCFASEGQLDLFPGPDQATPTRAPGAPTRRRSIETQSSETSPGAKPPEESPQE